jgi:hypothetical protein
LALGPSANEGQRAAQFRSGISFFFGLAATGATQIDLGAPTSAEQLDNATMQENLAYLVSLIFEPSCFSNVKKAMSIPYNPIIGL